MIPSPSEQAPAVEQPAESHASPENALARASRRLARAESVLAGWILAAVFAVVLANVAGRAVGRPLIWADEAAVYAMAWAAFIAASAGVAGRDHVAITLLPDRLSSAHRETLSRVVDVVLFTLLLALAAMLWLWFDPLAYALAESPADYARESFNFMHQEPTTTLGIRKVWVWLALPLFTAGALIHVVAQAGQSGARAPRPHPHAPTGSTGMIPALGFAACLGGRACRWPSRCWPWRCSTSHRTKATGCLLASIPSQMFGGLDNYGLLALPLFVLLGELMGSGGIGRRLDRVWRWRCSGRCCGGLAYVNLVANMLMASILGSTVAQITVMSRLVVPEMERAGYPRDVSVAITAAGGLLAPVIPPSMMFIIFGVDRAGAHRRALRRGHRAGPAHVHRVHRGDRPCSADGTASPPHEARPMRGARSGAIIEALPALGGSGGRHRQHPGGAWRRPPRPPRWRAWRRSRWGASCTGSCRGPTCRVRVRGHGHGPRRWCCC